jgi:hypothetical protein
VGRVLITRLAPGVLADAVSGKAIAGTLVSEMPA